MAENQTAQPDNGPAQIQTPAQYPTASRIENGIAYDKTGKALGPYDENNSAPQQTDDFFTKLGGQVVQQHGQTPVAQQGKSDDFFAKLGGQVVQPAQQPPQEQPGYFKRLAQSVGAPSSLEDVKSVAQVPKTFGDFLRTTLTNASGIEGAQQLYEYGHKIFGDKAEAEKEIHESLQNINEGGPVGANIGKGVGAVLKAGTRAVPFIGEPTYTAGEDISQGNYAGAAGGLTGVVAQLALPELIEKGGAAIKGDIGRLDTAVKTRTSAQQTAFGRRNELDIATRQVQDADNVLAQTRQAEQAGQGTRQQTIEAENNASAARANAGKAQKAAAEADEAHTQSKLEVNKIVRRLTEKAAKVAAPKIQELRSAEEDFRKIAPPAEKGPAAYTDKDYQVARGYLEEHHENVEPIRSKQDLYDALDHTQKSMENQVKPYIEKYKNDTVNNNVLTDVRDGLGDSSRAPFIEDGMNSLLKEFPQLAESDLTVAEMEKMRGDLVAMNRDALNSKTWPDVATALKANPEFAARYHAIDSLRDHLYDLLEDRGVKGIRELRQDESSIIRVRNATAKGLTKGEVKVRGSGQSGPIRKAAAWAAEKTGAMIGAAAGTKVGAPVAGAGVGSWAGEKLGRAIAPGDLTQNQLVQRSFKIRGGGVPTTEIMGPGVPGAAPKGLALSPRDMQQIMREQGPLHSELATHYGEPVDQSTYAQLENRFMQDIADKQEHGVSLEAPEKQLLKQINQTNAADALKAREVAQQEALSGKTIGEFNLPEKTEPVLDAGTLPHGMTTQDALVHDLAHVVVGDEMGLKFGDGIRSHLHGENVGTGNKMTAPIDWTGLVDEEGNVDFNKLTKMMPEIATTYVAGGVANDLFHDVPFTENHGLGADMSALKQFMKKAGFSEAEASKMIAQAAEDAATILSRPGMRDILEGHAGLREAGLSDKYHFSPERIDQVLQDVKEGTKREATTRKPAGTNAEGNNRASESGAGAEGKSKEQSAKSVREKSEGSAEGKERSTGKSAESSAATGEGSGAAKPNNPAFSGEQPELTHRRTDKGGEIRLDTEQEGLLKNRGLLKYTNTSDDTAAITAANLDKDFRGRGLGKQMYEKAADEARAAGKKFLTSDLGGQDSYDSARVWESLKREHPDEIESFPNKPGSPGYRWDLEAQPESLLTAEHQTDLPHDYEMEITHPTGETTTKNISALSHKKAIQAAQKEFPQASQVGINQRLPRIESTEYKVPTQKVKKISGIQREGRDAEDVMHHELGHFFIGNEHGFHPDEILSSSHSGMTRTRNSRALAAVRWDLEKSGLLNDKGRFAPETLGDKLPKLVEMYMGGIAQDELNGFPRDTGASNNASYGGDRGMIERVLRNAGKTPDEASAMSQAAIDSAKQKLQHPVTSAMIKENAPFREKGLSQQYHYSGERLRQMAAEHARRMEDYGRQQANNGRVNEETGIGLPTLDAGTEAASGGRTGQVFQQAAEVTPEFDLAAAAKRGIKERTTGNPEFDQMIKNEGMIPSGFLKADPESGLEAHALFTHPETGSTMAAKFSQMSPETIRENMAAQAAQYNKVKPQNPAFSSERVSTRVPSGKNATENPLKGEPLVVGRAAVEASPEKLQDRFADKVRKIEGVKIPKGITDNAKVFDRFTRHVADNLKWLYNQVPKEQQVANAKWYDSANNMTKQLAGQHGIEHRQAAGVMAAMSPQMDWDMNVSLGKRIMDIYKNHADQVVNPEMIQKGKELIEKSRGGKDKTANTNLENILDKIQGKKIGELTDFERAAAVRLYDETYNPRQFPRIDPATGNEMEFRTNADGSTSNLGWGNLNNAAKALSILDDGSRENISQQVGDSHKVRNFYNNIIDPSNPDDVTIDTHAVGAAMLHPVSGFSKIVTDNFGAGGSNLGTGVRGTYPLYAEGYRQAAKELGLKARELQSITWEKVRDLFPAEWKSKENLARVQKEWKKYTDGKQTMDQTRQNILQMGNDARAEINANREAGLAKAQAKLDKQKKTSYNETAINAGANALAQKVE